jgi:hypothetical protein
VEPGRTDVPSRTPRDAVLERGQVTPLCSPDLPLRVCAYGGDMTQATTCVCADFFSNSPSARPAYLASGGLVHNQKEWV